MDALQKLFVPDYIAAKLKVFGFDEKCLAYHKPMERVFLFDIMMMDYDAMSYNPKYDGCTLAPLYQQVTDWFREKHNIEIAVQWFDNGYIKAVRKKPFRGNRYRIEGDKDFKEIWCKAFEEALTLI